MTAPRDGLTASERRRFDSDGFVSLGCIADEGNVAAIVAADERLRGHGSPDAVGGPPDGISAHRHVMDRSSAVRNFAVSGAHVPAVVDLIGRNVGVAYSQICTRWPGNTGSSRSIPLHQDNAYTLVEPSTNVSVFLALTDADAAAGGLWMVPGSHCEGLLPHVRRPGGPPDLDLEVHAEHARAVPVPLRRGEVLLMSGFTLHGSRANASDRCRALLLLVYVNASARIVADGSYCWSRPHFALARGGLPPQAIGGA